MTTDTDEIELITCPTCNGSKQTDCCDGHMCPGFRSCGDCNGKGVRLSERDRKRKNALNKLLEYR